MARVGIQIDVAALTKTTTAAASRDLNRRANAVANMARRKVDVDEGRLRASIGYELDETPTGIIARIGTPLDYGLYRHEGTGIYGPRGAPIKPKRGQVLAWPVKNNSGRGNRRYSGGKTANMAFARSVKGAKGNPFLRDSLDAAR